MSDPFLVIAPRDRDRARAYTIEWLSGRPVASTLDVHLETASGANRRAMLAVQRVQTEEGRFHVLVIIVDLDAPARVRTGPKDLQQLATAIAGGVPEPFMIVRDAQPRVLFANRAASELAAEAGWGAWHSNSPADLLAAAGVHDAESELARARATNSVVQVKGVVRRVPYDIAIFPTGSGFVVWWREASGVAIGAPRDRP